MPPNGDESWRRTHDWGRLTRAEIAAARDAGALPILPIGAVEQHGDHLPVDTDSFLASRVSELAAAGCTPHVLILPCPAYGFSPHHREWAGTVSLSAATLQALVTDIAESVIGAGFDRLLLVNGHGGNRGPLTAVCTELGARGIGVGLVNYIVPGQKGWAPHLPERFRRVGHACAYETALTMALRPEDADRLAARVAGLPPRLVPPYIAEGGSDPMEPVGATWSFFFPGDDPGYFGDPAIATTALGEALLAPTVEALAAFFTRFAETRFKVGRP